MPAPVFALIFTELPEQNVVRPPAVAVAVGNGLTVTVHCLSCCSLQLVVAFVAKTVYVPALVWLP